MCRRTQALKAKLNHQHKRTREKCHGNVQRISDILSANFNDMVENWEEPEKMLKQAIREMEITIEESSRSVAKAMASEKLVGKELTDNQRKPRSGKLAPKPQSLQATMRWRAKHLLGSRNTRSWRPRFWTSTQPRRKQALRSTAIGSDAREARRCQAPPGHLVGRRRRPTFAQSSNRETRPEAKRRCVREIRPDAGKGRDGGSRGRCPARVSFRAVGVAARYRHGKLTKARIWRLTQNWPNSKRSCRSDYFLGRS